LRSTVGLRRAVRVSSAALFFRRTAQQQSDADAYEGQEEYDYDRHADDEQRVRSLLRWNCEVCLACRVVRGLMNCLSGRRHLQSRRGPRIRSFGRRGRFASAERIFRQYPGRIHTRRG